MKRRWLLGLLLAGMGFAVAVAACAPAAGTMPPDNTPAPITTETVSEATQPPAATQAPEATSLPAATGTPPQAGATDAPTAEATSGPTATPIVEARMVELEWPPQMRLGESDLVRLSLVPLDE